MRFVLASSNLHKAKEINAMLPRQFELVVQSDLGVDSPEETGSTFIENAIIKARHAAEVTGIPAIADDSGLCVNSLSGAPGVHSARFAGESATDEDNVNLLLQRLEGVSERSASFHCVLVCMRSAADPAPTIAAASWHGTIASQRTGMGGFGYDPVFEIKGQSRTAAELTAVEKNAISHRGLALKKLCDALIEQYSS